MVKIQIIGTAPVLGLLLAWGLVAGMSVAQGESDVYGLEPAVQGNGQRRAVASAAAPVTAMSVPPEAALRLSPARASAWWATGTVTGVVSEQATGLPISGTQVAVYDAVSFAALVHVWTDANGHYAATVTAPYGRVKVCAGLGGEYVPRWYNGRASFSEADAISLGAQTQTGKNVALARSGSVSVTVRLDDGGMPPDAVQVWLSSVDALWGTETLCVADGSGHCLLPHVLPGTYKMRLSDGDWPGIVAEWYPDQASSEAATLIAVAANATTEVVARVSLNGVLGGTVTDEESHAGLAGTGVKAYGAGERPFVAQTGDGGERPLGEYALALPPGRYQVWFDAPSVLYMSEWYNDAATGAGGSGSPLADWIAVTGGMTTVVDAALTPYTRTGTITGTITRDGGRPLDDTAILSGKGQAVEVRLYDPTVSQYLDTALLFVGDGATTHYSVAVPAGSYKLEFGSPERVFEPQWYNGAADWDTAGVIVVPDGGAITGINADMQTASVGPGNLGCISGMVTANGVPGDGQLHLPQTIVQALRQGEAWSYGSAGVDHDPEGMYQICHLEPGHYQVSFSTFPSVTTWYSNALSRADAAMVTVTANVTTPNVNGTAGHALGACILGRLVGVDGQARPEAAFRVYDAGGAQVAFWQGCWGVSLVNDAHPDRDGGFVACGLSAGTYTVYGYELLGKHPNQVMLEGYSARVTLMAGEVQGVGHIVLGRSVYLPVVTRG